MLAFSSRAAALAASSNKVISRILPSIMGDIQQDPSAANGCVSKQPKCRFHGDYNPDGTCHSTVRGIDYLKDSRLNKEMAFTLYERQSLGIHGLLPPAFKTQDEQVELALQNVDRYQEPLNQYIYLMNLQDRNERLFYRILVEYVDKMMPIVYTPTVGLACQKYGLIYRRPRGLFITINDAGYIYDIICNWPESNVKAVVVTDGERILGLGDLGAYGMGIPVGKLALYTALAGIKPYQTLPVVLDVGTNNEAHLEDPLYIGLRQKRVRGPAYEALLDEFMHAIIRRYGSQCLIQFEDFGNQNAFWILEKYKNTFCTFNDDIQGTASVAVAGIFASLRITGKKMIDNTFLFLGAGEAASGIANLLTRAMEEQGLTTEQARSKIWMVDKYGLLVKNRPVGHLDGHKGNYVKDHPPMENFEEIVKAVRPTAIMGAAASGPLFTENILRFMGEINERPIIFALSNPTSKAECTAAQAYTFTEGRCVFASGSPFPPFEYNGKTFYPGQGNNAYIFPGVALGVIACRVHTISDDIFLLAAKTVAELVTQEHLQQGRVYPPLGTIREVSIKIATEVANFAYKTDIACRYPEPKDKESFLRGEMYNYYYPAALPTTYNWPEQA